MKRVTINWVILAGFILTSFSLSAQIEIKSPVIEIRVGDKMPDIELGEVLNNYEGKKKFSDFKGKLLILDFWSTYCSVCMAAFPKMEALQKKFGESIQIILINTSETQKDIENRILKLKLKTKYKFPDLPSIVNAQYLHKLFPHIGVPFHVWIDGQGIVRLTGNGANTNEEKISDLLAGKEINYLRNEYEYSSGRLGVDNSRPIFNQIDKSITNAVKFSSIITTYNDSLWDVAGSVLENQADSISQTLRNCYLNREILDLYKSAFSKIFPKAEMQYDIHVANFWHRIRLITSDTLRYTSRILPGEIRTDAHYRRNRFSYEQIVPLGLSVEKQGQYMINDLNRYFGELYGLEGKIENVKRECYVLVRTSSGNKLEVTNYDIKRQDVQIVKQGKNKTIYKGIELKTLIESLVTKLLDENSSAILLDETGYKGRVVSMELPDFNDIKSLEDIRESLKHYNLDIVVQERELKMMVIKEGL